MNKLDAQTLKQKIHVMHPDRNHHRSMFNDAQHKGSNDIIILMTHQVSSCGLSVIMRGQACVTVFASSESMHS